MSSRCLRHLSCGVVTCCGELPRQSNVSSDSLRPDSSASTRPPAGSPSSWAMLMKRVYEAAGVQPVRRGDDSNQLQRARSKGSPRKDLTALWPVGRHYSHLGQSTWTTGWSSGQRHKPNSLYPGRKAREFFRGIRDVLQPRRRQCLTMLATYLQALRS